MKKAVVKRLAQISVLAVITMIAASAAVKAQNLENRLIANIPFDFTVNNKKLPAGEYSVYRAQPNNGDLVLQIAGADRQHILSGITFGISTPIPRKEGTLVFHRYGDEYFLSEVWPAGANSGRAFRQSRNERAIQQRTQDAVGAEAMKTRQPEIVTVAVSLH